MKDSLLLIIALLIILTVIISALVWKKLSSCKFRPFITGWITFLVASLVIESFFNSVMFNAFPILSQSTLLYVIYGTLAAGIFEETGRYIAFSFLKRKGSEKADAVMYGLGHGGGEAVMAVAVTYILFYLIVKGLLQADSASMSVISAQISGVTESQLFLSFGERICAITLHVFMSLLVWQAVNLPGRKFLFPAAIIIHALFDVPAALFQRGLLPLPTVEIILAVIAVIFLILTVKIYKSIHNNSEA